jgi:hypothetical protein
VNSFDSHNRFSLTKALSPEESESLEKYKIATDGLAYQLNGFLRGHKLEVPPDPIHYRQLDSAICKGRVLESIRLFRATFSEDFDPFVRDGIFHDPAYASTSVNESNLGRHFVNGFSRHPVKLIISCPQGANALYLELANDNGESESECLLPRCGRYRIDGVHPSVMGIKAIAKAMGHSARTIEHLKRGYVRVIEAWDNLLTTVQNSKAQACHADKLGALLGAMSDFKSKLWPVKGPPNMEKTRDATKQIQDLWRSIQREIRKENDEEMNKDQKTVDRYRSGPYDYLIDQSEKFFQQLDEWWQLGHKYRSCDHARLLLTGEAGIGKSHILAAIVGEARKRGQPALLLLGDPRQS